MLPVASCRMVVLFEARGQEQVAHVLSEGFPQIQLVMDVVHQVHQVEASNHRLLVLAGSKYHCRHSGSKKHDGVRTSDLVRFYASGTHSTARQDAHRHESVEALLDDAHEGHGAWSRAFLRQVHRGRNWS